MAADVPWVQISDQNRLLSFGRYGQPAPPEDFSPYFWMRDSGDAKEIRVDVEGEAARLDYVQLNFAEP